MIRLTNPGMARIVSFHAGLSFGSGGRGGPVKSSWPVLRLGIDVERLTVQDLKLDKMDVNRVTVACCVDQFPHLRGADGGTASFQCI